MIPAQEFKRIVRILSRYVNYQKKEIYNNIAIRDIDGQWQFDGLNEFARIFYKVKHEAICEGVYPFKVFYQLARIMPNDDTICFKMVDKRLFFETNVTAGFIWPFTSLKDFPSLPNEWVTQAALNLSFKGVEVATAKDSARPILNHVFFKRDLICATDGFRLHIQHCNEHDWEGHFDKGGFHFRAFPSDAKRVEFGIDEGRVGGDGWHVRAPLSITDYPDVIRVLPPTHGLHPVYIDDSLLESRVILNGLPLSTERRTMLIDERGILLGKEKEHLVRLKSTVRTPPKKHIYMNARFVIDALRFLDGPTTLYLTDDTVPLRLESSQKTAVIMPMKRLESSVWSNLMQSVNF